MPTEYLGLYGVFFNHALRFYSLFGKINDDDRRYILDNSYKDLTYIFTTFGYALAPKAIPFMFK